MPIIKGTPENIRRSKAKFIELYEHLAAVGVDEDPDALDDLGAEAYCLINWLGLGQMTLTDLYKIVKNK